MKQIERNEFTAAFFFIEFLVIMILTGMFLLPLACENSDEDFGTHKIFFIPLTVFLVLGTLLILFFSLSSFTDPGYVKRDP